MKFNSPLRMSLLLMMPALMFLVAQAEVRASSTSPPESQRYSFTTAKADDATVVRFLLPGFDRQVADSATATERVSVPGLASTAFAGLPALPYKTFKIAPEYSSTPQIIIRDSTYVDYDINLAHNPAVEYDSLGVPHYNDVPCTMYQGFMPSEIARVTDTQIYRGRPIYTITIMPMKYDRALGRLRVFTSLDIDIVYTPGVSTQSTTANRSAAFNSYTNRTLSSILGDDYVTNPVTESSYDVATQAGIIGDVDIVPFGLDEAEDYLVVSFGNVFDQAIDNLREWKKKLGYQVHSVSSLDWTQQQVQDTIKYFYNTLPNLTNVLIIGTDTCVPGNSVAEKLWRPFGAKDSTTDFYYMCMDGDNDLTPDVAYGRIPVYDQLDAAIAIHKIIKYEKGLYNDAASYRKAFVAGEYGVDETTGAKRADRFIPTLEEVRDILQAPDITTQRIYNSNYQSKPSTWYPNYTNPFHGEEVELPSYLKKPNFTWNGTQQLLINAFNEGINLGIYNGHGSEKGWQEYKFDCLACDRLTSSKSAPLVFSISCSTANHYINNDCLVAALVRHRYGPIAVIASSNSTYLGWSDALLLGMADAIFPNKYTFNGWSDSILRKPIYRLYDIMNAGHSRLENAQGGGYWDAPGISGSDLCNSHILFQRVNFHVYGDPSLNYNAFCPTEYNVSPVLGNNNITLNISNSDLPAKVVLRNLRTDKIRMRMITESSTINDCKFFLPTGDTTEITISGPNKIPYIQKFVGRSMPLQTGSITNVTYDRTTQTAVVAYTSTANPTFEVYDFNNNEYIVNSELISGEKKVKLYLNDVPNGLCVIAMMINGEKVDTYKFTKL